jgi:hypothetical protein
MIEKDKITSGRSLVLKKVIIVESALIVFSIFFLLFDLNVIIGIFLISNFIIILIFPLINKHIKWGFKLLLVLLLNLMLLMPFVFSYGPFTGELNDKPAINVNLTAKWFEERPKGLSLIDESTENFKGWNKFEADSFELYLPELWEGANEDEFDSLIEMFNQMGYFDMAYDLEEARHWMLFWAYDVQTPLDMEILTSFSISKEPDVFMSIDEIMEVIYGEVAQDFESLGEAFTIIEQDIVPMGEHEELGRTVCEINTIVKYKGIQYVIKEGFDVWILTFLTEDDLDKYMDTIDKVIETFNIK